MREIKCRIMSRAGSWVYFGVYAGKPNIATKPETLGEYTGLKDKNGVDIYEGDIFSAWDGRSEYAIEWLDRDASFKLVWISGDVGDSKVRHYFDMLMAEYQFDKVGNIHQKLEISSINKRITEVI